MRTHTPLGTARRGVTARSRRSATWLALVWPVVALHGVCAPIEHAAASGCVPSTVQQQFEQAEVVADFWIIDVEDRVRGEVEQRIRVRLGRVFKGPPGLTSGAEVEVVWLGAVANYGPMDSRSIGGGRIGFFERLRGGLALHPCAGGLAISAPLPEWLRRALRERP